MAKKEHYRRRMHVSALLKSLLGIAAVLGLPYGFAITGGSRVSESDPIAESVVSLVVNGNSNGHLCTGVILEDDIILTAEHCLDSDVKNMSIGFGRFAYSPMNYRSPIRQLRIPKPKKYEKQASAPDLALLLFSDGLPPGYKKATLLAMEEDLKSYRQVHVAGYGETGNGKGDAGPLRKAVIEDALIASSDSRWEIVISHFRQGTCRGDSGGPAFVWKDGRYQLFGITSSEWHWATGVEADNIDPDAPCGKWGMAVDIRKPDVAEEIRKAVQKIRLPRTRR